MGKPVRKLSLLSLVLVMAGCGGSSSDDEQSNYTDAYVQFYNVSENSYNTSLNINDSSIGTASFSDTTPVVSITPDNYSISLSYYDQYGDLLEPLSMDVSLSSGEKSLYILHGDVGESNLIEFNWSRNNYESDDGVDQFKLLLTNLSSNPEPLELYLAEPGVAFSDATLLGSATTNQLTETTTFDEDEYRIFVVDGNSEQILFQSDLVNFQYSTEYLIAVRDSYGPSESDYSIDIISNSSSVTHLSDEHAVGQFRIINSSDSFSDAKLQISDDNQSYDTIFDSLNVHQLSSYAIQPIDDYQLSIVSEDTTLLDNYLLTLNANESKTLILFANQQGGMSALAIDEQIYLNAYNHEVTAVNLTDLSDLTLVFVADDETSETAEHRINNLDIHDDDSETVASGEYDIMLLKEDENDQTIIVSRVDNVQINETGNYILLIDNDQLGNTRVTLTK